MMPRPFCFSPAPPPHAIDYTQEATYFTFYLDPGLLLATVHNMVLGTTGVLVWVHREASGEGSPPAVHPVLRVHATYEAPHAEHVALVPHLHAHDPLRQHIVAVLRAASEAADMAGRLFAESLANALSVHLLRRYAAGGQPGQECPTGLSPSKLRRTTAYIQAHLEHELSLTTLATVAQISPAHFARLFKQATGHTPHQYVILCRIERAKQLLAETDLPLSEIGYQVGCTDQSYFTALFRRYAATTPKAYRDNAQKL
jgi:AraC family transcriptional regulator